MINATAPGFQELPGSNFTASFELPALLSVIFSMQNDGIIMTLATFPCTALLEIASAASTLRILRQKDGQRLYLKAVVCNLVNNGILGPPLYWLVATHFMQPALPPMAQLAKVGTILLGHAVGYYAAHRWMHTRKMYWAHRFHHRFNVNVSPVVANAVSLAEYFIAYMLPFVVGAALIRPDRLSLLVGVGIVSMNNLLIHTPWLHDLSEQWVPWWAVSTSDHLEHHKRLTTHWAAPTISIDRLLACAFGKPASWGAEFKED